MFLESWIPGSPQPDKPNPQPPTPIPTKPNPDQPKPPPSESDECLTRSISSGLTGAVHDTQLLSVAHRGPGQPGPKPQPRPDENGAKATFVGPKTPPDPNGGKYIPQEPRIEFGYNCNGNNTRGGPREPVKPRPKPKPNPDPNGRCIHPISKGPKQPPPVKPIPKPAPPPAPNGYPWQTVGKPVMVLAY
ncbi:hypothetical protein LTR70_002850 [Exophiala xenobiotica]|uniref:Uncharacterized protein n=1 Tax=Lithohypha guttulata TaxID=1690604 RepID=A0ABR0KJ21_9EURO|nr:hypothetical protein LTR24_002064 [Lithohypha guttulata]KAK5324566.1 hypothetical protein LTR70_002850 [Exophiala xenobiotica]